MKRQTYADMTVHKLLSYGYLDFGAWKIQIFFISQHYSGYNCQMSDYINKILYDIIHSPHKHNPGMGIEQIKSSREDQKFAN